MERIKTLIREFLDTYEPRLKDLWIWGAVWLFTYLTAAIRAWLSAPEPLMGFGAVGNDAMDPTFNVVSSAGLVMVLRFLLPILLKILTELMSAAPLVALIVSLTLTSTTQAGEIEGPEIIPLGRLGEYRAKIAEASTPAWFVSPRDTASCKVLGRDFVLTGLPGRYTIDLLELSLAADGKTINSAQSTRSVTVTSDTPIPPFPPVPPQPTPPAPPTPTPPKPPTPPPPTPVVVPDGFEGLTKWANTQAASLSVDQSQRDEVAGMFRSTSSALAAGGIASPNELLLTTAEALNARGTAWTSFRKALGQELERLGFRRRSAGDFVQAWNAIADGVIWR